MQPHLDFGEVSSNSKWRSCRHSGRFLRTFCGKGHVNLRLLQKMDFMFAKACFDHTGVLVPRTVKPSSNRSEAPPKGLREISDCFPIVLM